MKWSSVPPVDIERRKASSLEIDRPREGRRARAGPPKRHALAPCYADVSDGSLVEQTTSLARDSGGQIARRGIYESVDGQRSDTSQNTVDRLLGTALSSRLNSGLQIFIPATG